MCFMPCEGHIKTMVWETQDRGAYVQMHLAGAHLLVATYKRTKALPSQGPYNLC